MDEFLVTKMPSGPVRDEIERLLKSHEHPFLVASDIGQLTEYMYSVKDSTALRANEEFSPETTVNIASNEAESSERLAVGRARMSQLQLTGQDRLLSQVNLAMNETADQRSFTKCTGFGGSSSVIRPIDIEGTSAVYQNESVSGGSKMIPDVSVVGRVEPRPPNVVNIVMGTAPEGATDSSGNSDVGKIVKKEGPKEEYLFCRNGPLPQPLFTLGQDANALAKGDMDEISEAVQRLVNVEHVNEEIDDSGELDEDVEAEEAEKTHQTMDEFLVTKVPPGPVRDEIMRLLKSHEHPFLISSDVDELAEYMHSVEDTTVHRSHYEFCHGTTINLASNKIGSSMRLASGCGRVPQFLLTGQDALLSQVKCAMNEAGADGAITILKEEVSETSGAVPTLTKEEQMNDESGHSGDQEEKGGAKNAEETRQSASLDPKNPRSSILDLKNCDALICIINQLDPPSFVKLARTCRGFYSFCFDTRGICVPFGSRGQAKYLALNCYQSEDETGVILDQRYQDCDGPPFPITERQLAMLHKMPFRLEIDILFIDVEIGAGAHRLLTEVLAFLQRFPRFRLRCVELRVNDFEWNSFVQFVKDHQVQCVDIRETLSTPLPPNVLEFFLSHLDEFQYHNYVPDDAIVSANLANLEFFEASISTDTFKILLKKFMTQPRWSSGYISWDIGREDFTEEYDPFIDVVIEMKTVTTVDDVDWTDMEPSVLYRTHENPWELRYVREDGVHLTVECYNSYVHFYTN